MLEPLMSHRAFDRREGLLHHEEVEMPRRDRYRVIIREIGGRWFVDVPALSIHIQCASFMDAEPWARDAISVMLNADPREFDVAINLKASA
jgi:hypothetical protein